MKTKPYKKSASIYFKVCGEEFEMHRSVEYEYNEVYAEIEEVAKNGQEDCHMSFQVYFDGKLWAPADEEPWDRGYDVTYEDIIKFLNKNDIFNKDNI